MEKHEKKHNNGGCMKEWPYGHKYAKVECECGTVFCWDCAGEKEGDQMSCPVCGSAHYVGE